MTHGTRSASQTHRNRICPGSAKLIESMGQVEQETSVFASEGTDKHALAVGILQGAEVDSDTPDDVLTAVSETAAIFNAVEAEYGKELILKFEEQVDLSLLGFEMTPDNNRIDCLIIVPGYGVVVIDWKFGVRYVPPAPWNDQLKAYAWGAINQYGGLWAWCHVIQPNALIGETVTDARWKYAETFVEIGSELAGINAKTREPNAPLVRGRHCDFCDAKPVCPQHRGVVLSVPQHVTVADHLKAISPIERSELYENVKATIRWMDAAKKAIESVAVKDGIHFEAHEIGPGKVSRKWKDPDGVMEALILDLREAGLSTDDLYDLKSPAKVEKLFTSKSSARDVIADLVERVPGKDTLKKRKKNGTGD